MEENIVNNKEKILDTKTLLKMRIDLENIYESKEKVVEDVQKQTKLVENLNIGNIAHIFEIYEKLTNYVFLKSYITKNKYSDIWKDLGVYNQVHYNMVKTYEYIENLINLKNNNDLKEKEKLDILEKILNSRVYIDYNKNFGKDKLYVTAKEKEELNIYRYDLIKYLEKLKLENRDYDIREDTENIYLNTFKIWAKISKKIKNDELYNEETNTILNAVGNNLKELKEEHVRLKNVEKDDDNIEEEKEINIFEVFEEMFRIYGRGRKTKIFKNSR